ncbi:MAG: hypothetical protein HWE10_15240, partial [Gammaproteobacteria bacterium]|nr:hypothetical protein [Gammaproteobacteria bacterium]
RYLGAYAKLKGQKDVDFPAYLDFITKKTTLNTGVLAVNMHVEQYTALLKYKLDVFNLNFGSIVYLERKDKLAQAVSLSKAQITDQWSSQTQAVAELPTNIPHSHVTKSLLHLVESHEYYLNQLASKTHFHYDYETFKSLDSLTCYQEPLAKLGIEIPQSVSLETGLTQQANKQSDEIKANYLSFINGN